MWLLHVLVLYLSVITPVWGYYSYKRFKRDYRKDPRIRTAYYRKTLIEIWTLTAVFAAYVYWKGIPWTQLGFAPAEWGRVSVLVLAGLISFTIMPLIMMKFIPGYREKVHEQLQTISDFLPDTKQEKRLWVFISLTAGICEELLFRCLLLYYFPLLIPVIAVLWAIVISSLLFGIGHCYQGTRGVVTAVIMGGIFACLYAFTGSIWLCMLLHALIDARILLMLPKTSAAERAL